jgi:hypothetical protein
MLRESVSQQLELDLDLSGIKEKKEDSSSRDASEFSKLNKLLNEDNNEYFK